MRWFKVTDAKNARAVIDPDQKCSLKEIVEGMKKVSPDKVRLPVSFARKVYIIRTAGATPKMSVK